MSIPVSEYYFKNPLNDQLFDEVKKKVIKGD
jgi:hypothetical protein